MTFGEGYVFEQVERFDDDVYQDLFHRYIGKPGWWNRLLNEESRTSHEELRKCWKYPGALKIAVHHRGNMVAFAHGWQTSADIYCMANSLVVPEHRNKGIYSELLRATLEYTREKGFHVVCSKHKATNNPILIAKLRRGFVITGMEVAEMGLLVQTSYFHVPVRKDIIDFRAGMETSNPKLRELFFAE